MLLETVLFETVRVSVSATANTSEVLDDAMCNQLGDAISPALWAMIEAIEDAIQRKVNRIFPSRFTISVKTD